MTKAKYKQGKQIRSISQFGEKNVVQVEWKDHTHISAYVTAIQNIVTGYCWRQII